MNSYPAYVILVFKYLFFISYQVEIFSFPNQHGEPEQVVVIHEESNSFMRGDAGSYESSNKNNMQCDENITHRRKRQSVCNYYCFVTHTVAYYIYIII